MNGHSVRPMRKPVKAHDATRSVHSRFGCEHRKPKVAATVTVSELFMIDAEQAQHGGVEIMQCTHLARPFHGKGRSSRQKNGLE